MNIVKEIKENQLIIVSCIFSIILFLGIPTILMFSVSDASDVNVWEYIVDSIKKGKIIYKDIFDHKGPMLYLFYYITTGYKLICQIVIFLLNEIIIYKITKLFIKTKYNIKHMIIGKICMILFACTAIDFPNAESYAIPFILISLYYFIKNILTPINPKNFFIIGLCFAIVVFLKENLVTAWVIIYPYFLIKLIKEKEYKKLIQIILYTILGILICTIPIIAYLLYTKSFKDFIDCYIIFNLKYTAASTEQTLMETIDFYFMQYFPIYSVILVLNILLVLFYKKIKLEKQERNLLIANLIYILLTILIVISPKRLYMHYCTVLMPTIIITLSILFENYKTYRMTRALLSTIVFIILFQGYFMSVNDIDVNYRKNTEYVVNWVKKNTEKDDNILVIGNAAIVYNNTNRKYNGKYFYQTPIVYNNTEKETAVLKEIENQKPQYIILAKFKEDFEVEFEEKVDKILEENYTKVEENIYKRN